MEKNQNYNQKYVEHLEGKIVEMRNENFELREKIVKLNDVNAQLREQIVNLSAKNRKLSHYGQFFGQIGNSIEKLHSQFEKARKRLPLDDNSETEKE